MKKTIILACFACWINYSQVAAQATQTSQEIDSIKAELNNLKSQVKASNSTSNKFVMLGDAFTGFKYVNDRNNSTNNKLSMTTTGINPVFLFTVKDKLIVESEIEFQLRGNNPSGSGFAQGEGLEIELEYMNLGYILNKYMIIRAGSFFSSYGTFEDWQHQRITNRMTSRPLGIGHGGLEPGTSLGFNLRGAFPVGTAKLNYSIDLVQAPTLNMGTGEIGADSVSARKANQSTAGELEYEVITDKRMTKNIGGRIGLLPFSNSTLELGVSAHYGKVGARGTINENTAATFWGLDLAYSKDVDDLKGTLLFRTQYDNLSVGDAIYSYSFLDVLGNTKTSVLPTFTNKSNSYYFQLSYRPTMAKSKFLRKCEIVGRYSNQQIPVGAKWVNDSPSGRTYGYKSQTGLSLVYWMAWNANLKFSYEANRWQDYRNSTLNPAPAFIMQMAIGF